MQAEIDLMEAIITRPGRGTIARGMVLAEAGEAHCVFLGPLEVKPGDSVGLMSHNQPTQLWKLEEGFTLKKSRKPESVVIVVRDESASWTAEASDKLYQDHPEFLDAALSPTTLITVSSLLRCPQDVENA